MVKDRYEAHVLKEGDGDTQQTAPGTVIPTRGIFTGNIVHANVFHFPLTGSNKQLLLFTRDSSVVGLTGTALTGEYRGNRNRNKESGLGHIWARLSADTGIRQNEQFDFHGTRHPRSNGFEVCYHVCLQRPKPVCDPAEMCRITSLHFCTQVKEHSHEQSTPKRH